MNTEMGWDYDDELMTMMLCTVDTYDWTHNYNANMK